MAKNEATWSRLDNAAKIFPCTSGKRDTKVFRFVCELKEEIEPLLLQKALDAALVDFPIYKCVLKKGLFWYYLESSSINPIITKEIKPPCSPLYIKNVKSLLFEVSYYKKRINLEVYHAISDGTGAVQFLQAIVTRYLYLSHDDVLDKLKVKGLDASIPEKMDDSFKRYYSTDGVKTKLKNEQAYAVKQPKYSENRISIIEGDMSLKSILAVAKQYNTTLTILLCALFMQSIYEEMSIRDRAKPVVLAIPVNLRKYFHSESIRNFFGVMNVGYNFDKNSPELCDIILHIAKIFKDELTADRLSERMNSLSAIENNMFARPVPLFLKDIVMRTATRIIEKEKTASLSNIGLIEMPTELAAYVEKFSVFVSTDVIQICMCSFGDTLNATFTSAYNNTEIQRRFFRKISRLNVDVVISTNIMDD